MPLRVGFDLDGVLADMEAALIREADILFGRLRDSNAQWDAPASLAEADGIPPGRAGQSEQPAGPSETSAQTTAPEPDPASSEKTSEDEDKELPLPKLALTTRQQQHLWRRVRQMENFWESLDEIEPGSVATLGQLAEEHGWEIIFVTQRPATVGYTAQVQSQRWLQRHGFTCPSVFVVSNSRGKIADALSLHAIVDDRPENCLDVKAESKARAVLLLRGDDRVKIISARRLGIEVVHTLRECFDLLIEADCALNSRPSLFSRLLGLNRASR